MVFDQIPNVAYYLQSLSVPGVSNTPAETSTGFGGTQYFHGDRLQFSELPLTFIVDDELNNYKELYDWLRSLTRAESYADYYTNDAIPDNKASYNAKLYILDDNKEIRRELTFINMFPVNLSEVELDYSDIDPEPIVCTGTFRYDYFRLEDNK